MQIKLGDGLNKRSSQFTPQQFDRINKLYWEDGYSQYKIADMFDCNQSHISRIVRGIACSYHCMLTDKLAKLKSNIKPLKHEAVQAKTMRAKRHRLHSTKLTWAKVVRIRKMYFSGKITQKELAKKFGLNQSTISRIISGDKWKELK